MVRRSLKAGDVELMARSVTSHSKRALPASAQMRLEVVTTMENNSEVLWQYCEVASPKLLRPVTVIAAKGLSYVSDANRLQNLNVYLPDTAEAGSLVGKPATALLDKMNGGIARYLVHIHGGAWRDPRLNADSIEPTVAHAYSSPDGDFQLKAIASINYTISQFSKDPTQPYDSIRNHHSDPAREAVHPQHLKDVLEGLRFLSTFGIVERSYILSGHSCGACIAFQAILQSPSYYGLTDGAKVPPPAAILGMNGLYDLPELVDGLGSSHEHLKPEYEMLLSNAFGTEREQWAAASPSCFNPAVVAKRANKNMVPHLMLLDQSMEDQLVPFNQLEKLEATLRASGLLSVIRLERCKGKHAAPWEQGLPIWECVQDALMFMRRNDLQEQ